MDPALAARLSGLLYGNVLHRNSDEDGYRYHFETLRDDQLALSALIVQFFTSVEFVEKFVVNQTPNELVHNLLNSFFASDGGGFTDMREWRTKLVHEGLDAVVASLVADPRFTVRHGSTGIPRYSERTAEAPRPRSPAR